jgi:Sulfotransferase family
MISTAMLDTLETGITITRADVLHIGYPKAASTFLGLFLDAHPQVTTDHNGLVPLLRAHPASDLPHATAKPSANKIHVSRDENVAESVCIVGDLNTWQRYKYVPGAWSRVKNDVCLDPTEAALRLQRVHSQAKIVLLIREQADWIQSAYKYAMSRLPARRRSFSDFCTTPVGVALLKAGHFHETINAYIKVFGRDRLLVLRSEDIVEAPKRFASELCGFIGISEWPLPQSRANETHTQIARIQRLFPSIERLPRNVKGALKSYLGPLIPGRRTTILSLHDVAILRSVYAGSNQRTDQLIDQQPS